MQESSTYVSSLDTPDGVNASSKSETQIPPIHEDSHADDYEHDTKSQQQDVDTELNNNNEDTGMCLYDLINLLHVFY